VLHDRYGLPLSTASTVAADQYVDGIDRMLSFNAGADECLEAAIAADAGFAPAHAAQALLRQFQGRGAEARSAAERAGACVAGASRRERQQVAAISTAVAGDTAGALALVREHLDEFPRDALLTYQGTNLITAIGGPDREHERLHFLEGLAPAYGEDWWFLSSHGFALHENQRFEESRRLSERSLAQYPRNTGASHNIAHVFYETLDNDGGADFLGEWIAGYDRGAPFHCHLSWHLALFALASGHYSRAMAIYERDISPTVAQNRLNLLDGAALLWRYAIYGCAAGPLPWRPVRDLAAQLTTRAGYAFGDVHAAMAFAATGDTDALTSLIDGWRGLAAKGHPLADAAMLPLIQGIDAFANGDYEAAIRHIEPVEGALHRVGGSHAQWELWQETLLEAYLRAERYEQAEALVRRRLDRRSSPRDLFWLGRAQAGRGAPEAAAAFAAARRRWSDAERDAPEQIALDRALADGAVR
jgi:tetratricopeptide (TPR) repeat protein